MDECSNLIYDETGGQSDMGQSDSKGARKRSNTPSGRGAAMSFGFRKKNTNKIGINNTSMASNLADKNGNGGSTEELYTGSPVTSGRSTPLARPKKEATGQPLRTNRFGFRQTTIPKTAKVGDINISVEQALTANLENKNNNISSDKSFAKPAYNNAPLGLIPTQVGSNGIANINPPNSNTRQSKQQTVILTYTAKQHPIVPNSHNLRSKSPAVPSRTNFQNFQINQRSASASRAYSNMGYTSDQPTRNIGKYTFQTNQLPKPQYPAVKVFDSKSAKQVANNSRKVYGSSSDGSSKEGSMTEDSGVSGLGDNAPCGDQVDSHWSPQVTRRQHRRPRTLEMIMHGDHNFQLRELQVNDLDIMDEAIITDNDVIPLPKMPSTFDQQKDTTEYFQIPENRFNLSSNKFSSQPGNNNNNNRSISSNLDRYRINKDTNRSVSDAENNFKYKGEEKASRDRIQHEKVEKKDYNKVTSSQDSSPLTVDSISKDSSPSSKEDSHPSIASSTGIDWMNQAAGESMALRSQDDVSVALTISSSCEDEKPFNKTTTSANFVPTTVDIVNKEPEISYASLSTHPMMLKSLSLSQHHGLHSMLMSSSMTSSAFSADTCSLVGNELRNLDLLIGDTRLRMATLTSSNHSLIEDETSPADSLISSSTDSNNDMPVLEKDITMSSSAYHTADNKTMEANKDDDDTCMEDNLKDKNCTEKSPSKKSPHSPDTPNASNSLSLSEGRDFLIDDEIADQPALIFEGNSTADQQTSSLQLINLNTTDNTPTLQETNQSVNKIKGLQQQSNQKMTASPLMHLKRSPSLDTLSPCDSIASDDLIMDMDLNHSVTSLNSVDEYIDRLDGSIRSGLNSLEDTQLRDELLKLTVRKYSSQILNGELAIGGTPVKHNSNSTSNSSLANIGATLPVRTGRLLSRSRTGTPESPLVADGSRASTAAGSASGIPPDDSVRLERATHGSMMHDIVTIKTMLLKLKRVLQEPDEEHNLMRTETLNPLDIQRDICPLKNGPSLKLGEIGEASPPPPPPAPQEEVADLRRQLVFLQSQLEDRERLVKLLQQQMIKYSETSNGIENNKCSNSGSSSEETCNVATQTERLRPTGQNSNILQTLSGDSQMPGSIVSWNEQTRSRGIPSSCHLRQSSSSPTSPVKRQAFSLVNSPANSDCETSISSHRPNHVKNGCINNKKKDISPSDGSQNPTNYKCKVSSKYLQAIANKQNGVKPYTTNSLIHNNNKSLHVRSKSIENFSKQLYVNDIDLNENVTNNRVVKDNSKKHHKSYTNLFNGHHENGYHSISNGKCKQNGHAKENVTDIDDNSDSGYKSLPPSLNVSNTKVSSIPRRTLMSELNPLNKHKQINTKV